MYEIVAGVRRAATDGSHEVRNMLASVIVPVHNNARYLPRVIEALLNQDIPREQYEVILVDNNSTDNSAEVIRRYPAVRLLTETKPGSYAARNRAVREAKGAVLAFTDSDCEVCSGWLRAALTEFDRTPASVLLGQSEPAVSRGLISLLLAYDLARVRFTCGLGDPRALYGYTNNLAVRREVWSRHGPFLEIRRGADSIFVRQVARHEPPPGAVFCPEMRMRHLELTSIFQYYKKTFIYGRSFRRNKVVGGARPLTALERSMVFREAVRQMRLGPAAALALSGCLAAGLCIWWIGGVAGRFDQGPASGV